MSDRYDPPATSPQPGLGEPAGLQHERTALAWERTAIAMMVAGVALARFAAVDAHLAVTTFGFAQVLAGGILLLWAGRHHDELHNPAFPASAVPKLALARTIGIGTVAFTAVAFGLVVLIAIGR